ncbi:hypothetical protein [Sorangium sp. So ce1024]
MGFSDVSAFYKAFRRWLVPFRAELGLSYAFGTSAAAPPREIER